MLFLMFLFCLDCELWTRSKINYVFIFEFDTRHCLDWRQLCEVSEPLCDAPLRQQSSPPLSRM